MSQPVFVSKDRSSGFRDSNLPDFRRKVLRLVRSEEHTSELQSHSDLVCRLLLEKKKNGEELYDPVIMTRHTRWSRWLGARDDTAAYMKTGRDTVLDRIEHGTLNENAS